MTTTNLPLYRALVKLGISDVDAQAAVTIDRADLATKADLQTELLSLHQQIRIEVAELKADLIKWQVGTLIAMAAIYAAIAKLL